MNRRTTHWALIFLIAYALAGCASPVSGHRLVEQIQPIKRISVVVQYGRPVNGGFNGDVDMSRLLERLSSRVPLMLTINGIATERTDSKFDLVIGPRVARTYIRREGPALVELTVGAAILDKVSGSRKIWEGAMIYVVSNSSSINDRAIDEFAKEFLEQLARDKVLDLQVDAIVMPSERQH